MKLVELIASKCEAFNHCVLHDNTEWELNHIVVLDGIERNLLPSGSGLDISPIIVKENSGQDKIVIKQAYHAMTDTGYYDRWIEFTITVRPTFGGNRYDIVGNFGKYQNLKDYILDTYDYVLRREVTEDSQGNVKFTK